MTTSMSRSMSRSVSRVGLCIDSASQIPPDLADRLGAFVVPMTVVIDDVEYHEGVDLDADQFYALYAAAGIAGRVPEIATSQPAPGAFADAYRALVERGVTEILSVHTGSTFSGTIASARIAAEMVPTPVHVVDTGTASFGVTCCLWAAADALGNGAAVADAAALAERRAADVATAFVVGVPELTRRSGRAAQVDEEIGTTSGLPILAMRGDALDVLGTAQNRREAVELMAGYVDAFAPAGQARRVAIGVSDESSRQLADDVRVAVRGLRDIDEVIDYRIGPSIGAHTGPGTAGLFVF